MKTIHWLNVYRLNLWTIHYKVVFIIILRCQQVRNDS